MCFARGDLRGHIVSYQNDRRPSYWPRRASRQQEHLKIDLREIFGVVRFSTFATISARNGPQAMSAIWSLIGGKRTSRGSPISVAIDPERTSPTSSGIAI